jgi:hypothetical protein
MFGLNARQLFLISLLICALFAGTQYIPVYFKALQFNDFIRGEAKFAASTRKTTEALRTSISEKAKEMQIPVTAKDIRITRRGPAFQLELEYAFPVNMRVYQHEVRFHVSEAGEIFEDDRN